MQVNIHCQLSTNDVFILASQAHQVYYIPFPSTRQNRQSWLVASKVMVRRSFAPNPALADLPLVDEGDEVFMDTDPSPTVERVNTAEVDTLLDESEEMEEVDEYDGMFDGGEDGELSDYEPSEDEDDIW